MKNDETATTFEQIPNSEAECLLVERVLAGDGEAYGTLVATYSRRVYNLAYRYLGSAEDAEDASQEVFLRAYERLSRFDRGRSFQAWLLAITANHCIDRLRRRGPKTMADAEEALQLVAGPDDPEGAVLGRERSKEMQRELAKLPGAYRMVLVLRYWQELSCEEIAAVLGSSVGAVKVKLHRARLALLEEMEGKGAAVAERYFTRPKAGTPAFAAA